MYCMCCVYCIYCTYVLYVLYVLCVLYILYVLYVLCVLHVLYSVSIQPLAMSRIPMRGEDEGVLSHSLRKHYPLALYRCLNH